MFSHSSSNNVLVKGSRTVAKNWSGFLYLSEVLIVTKHKRGNGSCMKTYKHTLLLLRLHQMKYVRLILRIFVSATGI